MILLLMDMKRCISNSVELLAERLEVPIMILGQFFSVVIPNSIISVIILMQRGRVR